MYSRFKILRFCTTSYNLMIDTSVTVKVCGVTLGVNERRRLTCLSGLLNDKVSSYSVYSSHN